MSNIKILASILLVLAVLFTQVGNVAAAPQTQDTTPIAGTVKNITSETNANGVTTVLVTLLLDDQVTIQTIRISDVLAAGFEIGQHVEIAPGDVIADEEPVEPDVHLISLLLAKFFNEAPSVIDGYHEDGFGFGVIAQALWMSQNLTGTESESGNASLAEEILQAKQDKNFEAFAEAHPEYFVDSTVPTNWGQFKKALQEKKNNLGVVVSGQEESDNTTDPALTDQDHGNGQDKNDKEKKPKKDKKNKP